MGCISLKQCKLSSFRVLRQYSATNSVLTLASEIHIFRHMPSNLEISLGQRFCTAGPRSAKSLALGVQNPRPREIGPRGYISQYIPPIGSVKFHHLWHFAILGTGIANIIFGLGLRAYKTSWQCVSKTLIRELFCTICAVSPYIRFCLCAFYVSKRWLYQRRSTQEWLWNSMYSGSNIPGRYFVHFQKSESLISNIFIPIYLWEYPWQRYLVRCNAALILKKWTISYFKRFRFKFSHFSTAGRASLQTACTHLRNVSRTIRNPQWVTTPNYIENLQKIELNLSLKKCLQIIQSYWKAINRVHLSPWSSSLSWSSVWSLSSSSSSPSSLTLLLSSPTFNQQTVLPGPVTPLFLPSLHFPLNGEPFIVIIIIIITIIISNIMSRYLAICHPLYSYTMAGLKRTARLILTNVNVILKL